MREQIARSLGDAAAIPVRVVHKPVLTSAEAIATACQDANAADACVGVIAWMHTFSPARMWIAGLRALQVPLLHLHTQFNRDLPWAEIDMDFMNLHQAAHGDREFGFIETRLGVARKTVVGHWEDPRVPARIGAWARAACGWHEAHHLRVARFGDNMRHVADTEGDKVEAQIRLRRDGQRLPAQRPDRCGRAAPDDAVDDVLAAYDAGLRGRPRPPARWRAARRAPRGGADRGRACGRS